MKTRTSRIGRMEALFNAALDLPVADRVAFLLREEPDSVLRAAVVRLLEHHAAGDAPIDQALDAAIVDTTAAWPARERIGAYRLIRELGAGGMGTVYLAERELGETRQRVALKLIRDFPTAHARERLTRESRLLAELNHPNIASLLDAGETPDRVPYLAMEYVEGVSLQAFCETHHLDVPARLRLFAELCGAVQHAHQHLIVHRDIKPSNILVREDGTPMLLDFGIGKLLDAASRDATATHVFTPAYAAPEQIAGRAVTTATDIYGLGCVLHELLSGQPLHESSANGRIAPPSAVTGGALSRTLRGELDTLVGKAMHAEPERRYASVQALSDDIENYLAGKPLRAAPDSIAYRARKFVARHRYAAIAAGVGALLVAVFVWRLDAETRRAFDAETHAEREAKSASRSRDFLVSLFEAAAPDNTLGHALTARELIDKGREHVARELKDEPDTAARLGLTIAGVYAALGDPKAAVESGERALELAAGDTPERGLLRSEILLTLSVEYDNTERFEDATRASTQALALRERFAPDDHARLGAVLALCAAVAVRHDDGKAARDYLDRAMAEFARAPKVDPSDRAEVLRAMADLDNREGRFAEAIAHAEQALHALDDLPPGSPARLDVWRMLATAQTSAGDGASAVATLERALEVARAALGPDSNKVGDVENDLAVSLNAEGRYRDAIGHLEKSIAITERIRPGARVATAYSTINLGSLYESLGDYAKAEELMRHGIAAIEAESPDESQLDFFRGNLARTLMLRGDLAGARALIERALANIAARDGEKSFAYAFQEFRLARIELVAGHLDAATTALDDAYAVLDPLLPPEHALRVQIHVLRGLVAKARGDLATAEQELQAAETGQGRLSPGDPIDLAIVRMRLAGVRLARGDAAGARRDLDASRPVLDAALLPTAIERIEADAIAAQLDARERISGR
ncbi:MAG TPA: serine/threonine-protein kinase [Rhodanobacteraceae bacterium]|nr:serine/threonine-protein kinase [Rhodanobacteraceae bacterium]